MQLKDDIGKSRAGNRKGASSSCTTSKDTISTVVKEVLVELLPTMSEIITTAVEASKAPLIQKLSDFGKESTVSSTSVDKIKCEVQLQRFELDKLEQYIRRGSIRVFGLS